MSDFYEPKEHTPGDYFHFWGTRGSIAVSGPEFARHGGNTSCLEVRQGNTLVIIDAGTGIRPLGKKVQKEQTKEVHLILSHLHWDHITGLPFFAPLYDPEFTVHIWAPDGLDQKAKELFCELFDYTYFPIQLDYIKAKMVYHDFDVSKPIQIDNIKVEAQETVHPGPTYGFKITVNDYELGYVTDNEFLAGYQGHPDKVEDQLLEEYRSFIDFFKDVNLFCHEAQYTPSEYHNKEWWGHTSVTNASILMRHTAAKEWLVTHHDPSHNDEDLTAKLHVHKDIMKEMGLECEVSFAHDGLEIPL